MLLYSSLFIVLVRDYKKYNKIYYCDKGIKCVKLQGWHYEEDDYLINFANRERAGMRMRLIKNKKDYRKKHNYKLWQKQKNLSLAMVTRLQLM